MKMRRLHLIYGLSESAMARGRYFEDDSLPKPTLLSKLKEKTVGKKYN